MNINNQNLFRTGKTTDAARCGYRLNSSGIAEQRGGTTYSTLETWLLAGAAGDYQARATIVSNSGTATGTFGTWAALSTSQEWSLTGVLNGGPCDMTITVEIRSTSTGAVLDSATINLESDPSSI